LFKQQIKEGALGRGRRGAYKAEKRRKELKRIKKQDEKRKRRLSSQGGEAEGSDETIVGEGAAEAGADVTAAVAENEAETPGSEEEEPEGAAGE
jgi:hypothetical protein